MTNVKEMHGNEIVRPLSKRWGAQLLRLAKELAPLSGLGLVALGILGWFHYEITRLDSRMDLLNQRMTTEIQNLRQDLQTEIRDVREEVREVRNSLQTEIRDVREEVNDVREEVNDVREEVRGLRDEVQGLRDETRQGLQALNERIDRLLLAQTSASVVPTAPGSAGRESSP